MVWVGGQDSPVVRQTNESLNSDTFPSGHNIPIKVLRFKTHNISNIQKLSNIFQKKKTEASGKSQVKTALTFG